MIKPRLFVLFAFAAGVPLAVACSSAPGTGTPGGPTPTTTGTTTTTPTTTTTTGPTGTTTSVPPGCPDPGICGPGLYWDSNACSCERGVAPPPPPPGYCDAGELPGCPPGWSFNPYDCSCFYNDGGPTPPPPAACEIPGYGACYPGETCVVGYCPNGGESVCYCNYDGSISCDSGCVGYPDAGYPDVGIYDAGPPPPWDAGAACFVPGFGECPSQTTCVVGTCPDGKTPVTCFCADGTSYCNGQCTGDGG